MIADLEAFIHKKYDRAPGPVHLSHFIYGLFEGDIHREGIKVDLKPLPYTPKVREIPKPPMPPVEKPKPLPEIQVVPPPPMPSPPPPVPRPAPSGAAVSINFDDDKAPVAAKRQAVPEKELFKPESLFHELEKEKRKFPLLPLAVVLLVGAIAAGVYFFVLNKPAAPAVDRKPVAQAAGATTAAGLPAPADTQTPAMKKIADELAATQKLLDEAKLKQEEELKQIQAEEEKKKIQEDRRKKVEADRLKKDEEERLKLEETARLQQEEESRKKQEETDRLKKEEEDRNKADELKRAEQNRIKEGDIVPMNNVDTAPVAISTPGPNIPASVRSSMQGDQTLMFTVLINHNGDVETVRLLQKSNVGQLNTILSELIKTWKYKPAVKDSLRVKVWKTVPMTIKK